MRVQSSSSVSGGLLSSVVDCSDPWWFVCVVHSEAMGVVSTNT